MNIKEGARAGKQACAFFFGTCGYVKGKDNFKKIEKDRRRMKEKERKKKEGKVTYVCYVEG